MTRKGIRRLNIKVLVIIGSKNTCLILLQPAKLRDQTGERVFSRDGRPIRDKGVLRQEAEGDEARDCY